MFFQIVYRPSLWVISISHVIFVESQLRKDRTHKQNSDCLCSVPVGTLPMDDACGDHFPFFLGDVCSDYTSWNASLCLLNRTIKIRLFVRLLKNDSRHAQTIKVFSRERLGSTALKDVLIRRGGDGQNPGSDG